MAQMTQNGMVLTVKKAKMMTALLSGKSIVAAAKEAGVSIRTAQRWSKSPDFQERLALILEQQMGEFTNRLIDLGSTALDVLARGLAGQRFVSDGSTREVLLDVSAGIQIGAARTVLENVLRQKEIMVIENRISRLEAMVREQEQTEEGFYHEE